MILIAGIAVKVLAADLKKIRWIINPNGFCRRKKSKESYCNRWKRALDVAYVMICLPAVIPLMVVVSIWIKSVSDGPLIFKQRRIGRNGRAFTLYKFRSMTADSETSQHEQHVRCLFNSDKPMVKLDMLNDRRLIYGARAMRAAGLDELPQLFNILSGNMSWVGPRPCLPYELNYLSLQQRDRFASRPGLTGLWQIEGKNRSTFNEMIRLDLTYNLSSSPWLDLLILARTPAAIMRQLRETMKINTGMTNSDTVEDDFKTKTTN
jgi:lipopolysaccharide/colanic/teichoic acid biosynthesis glycosyltransferase